MLPRYTPLLLLALAWEAVTRAGLVPTSALPPLDTVARAWYDLASSGDLWTNGVASMSRGAAGLGAGDRLRQPDRRADGLVQAGPGRR